MEGGLGPALGVRTGVDVEGPRGNRTVDALHDNVRRIDDLDDIHDAHDVVVAEPLQHVHLPHDEPLDIVEPPFGRSLANHLDGQAALPPCHPTG